jgi:hypothetical protein
VANKRTKLERFATFATYNATPGSHDLGSVADAVVAAGDHAQGTLAVDVVATGRTSGFVNCYRLSAGWKYATAGTTLSIIGTVTSTLTCVQDAAWDCTLAFLGAGWPQAFITLTGDAAETVDWAVFATFATDSQS